MVRLSVVFLAVASLAVVSAKPDESDYNLEKSDRILEAREILEAGKWIEGESEMVKRIMDVQMERRALGRRATECYGDCVTRCNAKTDATEKATCLTGCASKAACTTSATTSTKTTSTSTKTTSTSTKTTTTAASSAKTHTAESCSSSSNGPPSGLPATFPTASGTRSCSAPITVSGTFDGGLFRYDRGAGYRVDDCTADDFEPGTAETIFLLNDGATLQNVIIGQEVQDSVYCLGSCTLKNVWFEKTCEDSLSFKNPTSCTSCTMNWTGGAVNGFVDKAVQHNGAGTATLTDIDVYYTESGSGKFYRSCGGCSYPTRHVVLNKIRAHGVKGEALVGINIDYDDTAKFTAISIPSSFGTSWPVCKKWPDKTSGADGTYCIYSSSDITWTSS